MAVINEKGETEYIETVPETGEVIETTSTPEESVEPVNEEPADFSGIMEG